MTSYSRYEEITLSKYTAKEATEEETVCLSGRTILLTQSPHVKADISAARGILQRLLLSRTVTSTDIVTDTDSISGNEVTSVHAVTGKGGTVR